MNRPGAETALRGVDVTGPVDATTLVFVHGAVYRRPMWAPQRRTGRKFRIVTVDLPNHGERAGTDSAVHAPGPLRYFSEVEQQ